MIMDLYEENLDHNEFANKLFIKDLQPWFGPRHQGFKMSLRLWLVSYQVYLTAILCNIKNIVVTMTVTQNLDRKYLKLTTIHIW